MSVGFPLGLLALAGIVPLVAAYFLRRKQHPKVVSALFLWRTPDRRAEAGPRLQRFSRELSLLLECLALVLAALYLADVRFGAQQAKKHLAVVVDGGLSMAARPGGAAVADRARDALAKWVHDEQATALTVIESGPSPRVLAGPQQDVERATAALEAWMPGQPAHAYEPAWRMAHELAGPGVQVLFLTDGPVPEGEAVPDWLEVRSVGVAADNVALVSAQRRDVGQVAQLTLRVANFGAHDAVVPVKVKGEGVAREEKLEVKAGGTVALRLGLTAKGPLEVALPDDALVEDGRVTLLPSPETDVEVALLKGLDAAADGALRRVLRALPGVKLTGEGAFTFGGAGAKAKVTVAATGALKSFVGPFFAQKANPLFEDVFLDGTVWTAGADNPPGRPLLTAGTVVLMSEEDDGALHLNLESARSNLSRTSAWPVLMNNVLRKARLETPGLPRRHLALGESVPVVLLPGAKHALVGPGGQRRPVLGQGAVSLPPLPAPGRWALERDGQEVDALVVLPLDARESDLRTRGPFEAGKPLAPALASLALERPRPWWPIVFLLALLLVNFWVTARARAT